jgi:geranylgeranylglycerol-phosphate geranylgeranyltransferase
MNVIRGYIQLTRPVNLLIAFGSIFVGGFVTGTIHPFSKLMLACFSGALIAAGANSINDYYDLEIDQINKPGRPLPSGLVTPSQACYFALILFAVGTLASSFIHLPGFVIALCSSLLLYLYSFRLKRTILWGNLTVALLSGMAFIYGGLAVGRYREAVIVGIFSFFFHLSREIIKDIEDMKGDRSEGLITLPLKYGVKSALVLASIVMVLLIGLTLVPYFMHIFSPVYLIIVIAGVDLFLAYVLFAMWIRPVPEHLGRLAVLMKADMLVGLLAVYFGRG